MCEIILADSARAADFAVVHAQSFEKKWDEATFRQILLMTGAFGFLAIENGAPVGMIACTQVLDEAEIATIGVIPAARRKTVAERLMTAAAAYVKARSGASLFLEVASDNAPAYALYVKCGFEKIGLRKGYYQTKNGAKDAVVMRLSL